MYRNTIELKMKNLILQNS